VECYVHGYLPEWADCLAFDASFCKCCDDWLVAVVQFVFTGSGLACPGVKCV